MLTEETVRSFRSLAELVPARWEQGRVTAADGTLLAYTRTGGDKPTLLLLHGVQGLGLMWLRTALAFEGRYDVIMPDFRGHGASGRLSAGAPPDLLVADTQTLLAELAIEQPAVIGHSMGADIAGRLAAEHPLRALVLVDPALVNLLGSLDEGRPPWMENVLAGLRALQAQPFEERLVGALQAMPPGTAGWAEADYVSFVEALGHFDLSLYDHMHLLGYLFEEPDVLARITAPTLLITAKPAQPGLAVEAAAQPFTRMGAQHLHLPESGHFVMFDAFDAFVDAVAGFLAG